MRDIKTYISDDDRLFISTMRGIAILTIVFYHVGGWVLLPYTSFLHAGGSSFFFFIGGGVLYHSFYRSKTIKYYYINRITNLLVPYYMLCIVSLAVFLIVNLRFPTFEISHIIKWLTVTPSNEMMPFPLGQLWFLNTYLLLFVVSPLYFYLYRCRRNIFFALLSLFIILSIFQLYFDITNSLVCCTINIYQILFCSTFFMIGILIFGQPIKYKLYIIIMGVGALIIFCFFTDHSAVVPDITSNFQNRDIVYFAATVIYISIVVALKKNIIIIIKKLKIVRTFLLFLHKNIFSFYLLHTASISLFELVYNPSNPEDKTYTYGIVKLIVVIFLTSLLALPFSKISKSVVNIMIRYIDHLLSNYIILLKQISVNSRNKISVKVKD